MTLAVHRTSKSMRRSAVSSSTLSTSHGSGRWSKAVAAGDVKGGQTFREGQVGKAAAQGTRMLACRAVAGVRIQPLPHR